jgi:hypothetical protein
MDASDWIALAAIVASGVTALYAKRETADAKIKAANAEGRVEEALRLLAERDKRERERDRQAAVARDAPGVLNAWICKAREEHPDARGWCITVPPPVVKFEVLLSSDDEVAAARLAVQRTAAEHDPDLVRCAGEVGIGQRFALWIYVQRQRSEYVSM